MIGDKKCSVCKEEKPVTEYNRKGLYLQAYCKSCSRKMYEKKTYGEKNTEFFRHDPRIVTI